MSKINSIVFSNDRPAQLKIFLDSVLKNASGIFDINVIINQSNEDFKKSYDSIVSDSIYSKVNFEYIQEDFKSQVLKTISNSEEYFSFFLDDDIIYRKIDYKNIVSEISSDDDVVCFSLRLGKNVTKCYTLGGVENVMHDMEEKDNIMKWDWSLHYLDFGYPFAMDGHIFRKKDIFKLVKKTQFSTVEELEVGLFDFTEIFPRKKMSSYITSALVGVPIARLQESLDNEMAAALRDSRARLMRSEINKKFLNGNFIKLEEIDFSEINGCHQDLDLGVHLKEESEEQKNNEKDG